MVLTLGIILILSAVLFMGLPQYITKANTASGAAEVHNNKYDAAKAEVDALGGVGGAIITPTPTGSPLPTATPIPTVTPTPTPIMYTVTFSYYDTLGVQVNPTQSVVSGDDAVAPTVPALTDYRFNAWNVAFTNITSNLTVTAQYIQTCTVTYSTDHGTVPPVATVDKGTPVTQPTSPHWNNGHSFKGWYTSSSGGTNWVFTSNVTSSMTLYAQFN